VTAARSSTVVVDTMVVSSLVNAHRQPTPTGEYRKLIARRPIVVSFATVTELRYGALKAGWGELRRRGLERDLARPVVVQPEDRLMQVCAELRARCEQAGHALGQKVHEADRWIAATALRLSADLVSDDTVFADVPGLVVASR
jgi:predicted nucleic acid-binding protein